jgi:hypothetical protein
MNTMEEFVQSYLAADMQPTREEWAHHLRTYQIGKKLVYATIVAQAASFLLFTNGAISGLYPLGLAVICVGQLAVQWLRASKIDMHTGVALHLGFQRQYPNGVTIPPQSSITITPIFKGE